MTAKKKKSARRRVKEEQIISVLNFDISGISDSDWMAHYLRARAEQLKAHGCPVLFAISNNNVTQSVGIKVMWEKRGK